ncbi:GtrA family protein [Segetibacter sp.]|jgi:putative flippase GtrA|uniref:GtrA family protein n=1 Tax=Segetibacter sp. TaxID=2231182 RepID=UPI00260B5E5D|nr:GtrA family protein [Segetibacter sp.]
MNNFLLSVIDFFYPLFRKFMPLQTFRYAACGGANTLLDIFLFGLFENRFKQHGVMHFQYFAISPHILAMIAAFCITFPIGFYYSRYLVFNESNLRGRVQLVRYFSMVLACIALNYMFLKFFIEQLHIHPIISKIITTAFVVTFSYLSQKHFTFKTKKIKHHTMH